jgi:acyl-CoA oxidase
MHAHAAQHARVRCAQTHTKPCALPTPTTAAAAAAAPAGDNTVLMQQVARSLLEDGAAVRAAASAAAAPRRFDLAAGGGAAARDPETLLALLRAREDGLLAGLAGALAAAGPGKAKEAAFEEELDRVVDLGWAYTERMCLQNMLAEAPRAARNAGAPAARALRALAALFGASRAERGAAGLLARGAIGGADAEALRGAVNSMCRALGGGGARAPALALCDAFGIPDHLIQAPIAFNWRAMGAQ